MNLKNRKLFVCSLIILSVIMLASFLFSVILASKAKVFADGECPAKAMVVIEASTGRVLEEKNKDDRLAMASTTKIMTALVTCKNTENFDEVVTIHDNAVGIEGTSMYLRKGEKLTVKELLFGLMLPSGNDAAMALAYHIGGGEEKFVEMMNAQASELGLKNTHFANPHGLDADGHYTSALDLALITAEGMKNDMFREIIATKNVRVTGSKENEPRLLSNKNRLLKTLDGCTGVKTGFTDNAGRCFVCSCTRDGMTLISVVLNCGPMFEQSARLMNLCFEKFKMYGLLEPYAQGDSILVTNGDQEFVQTVTKHGFSYPLTDEEFQSVKIVRNQPEILDAPVVKEQKIGEIEIYLDKDLLFKENIYTMENVKSIKYLDKIWEIVDQWNI